MDQAFVGLIGVIVGGGVTGAVKLGLRRSADRRDARAGARLLQDAFVATMIPKDASTLPEVYDFDQTIEAWKEHRTMLASSLTKDEWEWVSEAANRAVAISGIVPGKLVLSGGSGQGLDPAAEFDGRISNLEAGVLQLLDREIYKASLLLERLAGGRRASWSLMREARQLGLLDKDGSVSR